MDQLFFTELFCLFLWKRFEIGENYSTSLQSVTSSCYTNPEKRKILILDLKELVSDRTQALIIIISTIMYVYYYQ